jgi:hypothetical protein
MWLSPDYYSSSTYILTGRRSVETTEMWSFSLRKLTTIEQRDDAPCRIAVFFAVSLQQLLNSFGRV